MADPPTELDGKGPETAGEQVEESLDSMSADKTAVDGTAARPESGPSDPTSGTPVPNPAETQTDEPAKTVNGGPSPPSENGKAGVVNGGGDDTRSVASSVATSELSSGALLALEIKREEIRKGKAPEVITPPSGSARHLSVADASTFAGPARDLMPPVDTSDPSQMALQKVLLDNARDNMSIGGNSYGLTVPGPSGAADTGPSVLEGELAAAAAEEEGYQDVEYVPWEKDPGRPVQKLPIRFKDCLGRTFIFPWEKAKTWEGTRRLIRHALSHVESVGEEVRKGRYDLIAWDVWASDEDAKINPNLTSYPQASSSTLPAAADPADQGQASSSSDQASQDSMPMTHIPGGPSTAAAPPPPLVALTTIQNPSGNTPTKDMSARTRNAVILPELWDSIVEPGMLISMVMWPMKHNHHHGSSSNNNNTMWGRGAGQPPPAIIHVGGRGRGGRGGHHGGHHGVHHGPPPPPGMGRGHGAGQPPPMPQPVGHMPPPPTWGVPAPPPRGRGPRLRVTEVPGRGKTRRRQER